MQARAHGSETRNPPASGLHRTGQPPSNGSGGGALLRLISVFTATHARGSSDTPFLGRDARRRALLVFLCLAALLHAPLVPTRLFDWLRLALSARDVELVDQPGETIIPIDFDLVPDAPAAPPAPPPEPAPAAAAPSAPAPTSTGGDAPKPPEKTPPEPPDAGAPVASAEPDAGVARRPAVKDPLAAAGAVGKLATTDPNVQVLIASDRIRKHPLGASFGRLLTTIPEWKSFFDGTDLDPIRDVDHVLIAGPQFRDSRHVVAVMDYNLPEARVKQAIDVVLQRSDPPGSWLEDSPVPAATARADGGDRIFAMVPGKRLLVVMPADAKEQLGKLKNAGSFNKSSAVGIAVSMVTPARAFKNTPVPVPESLKWMRLAVIPAADGGAEVMLDLMDESEASATEHAAEMGKAIEALRKPDLGILAGLASIELFGPVSTTTEGAMIRLGTRVSEGQLRRIMTWVEAELTRIGQRRTDRQRKDKAPSNKVSPAPGPQAAPTQTPPSAPVPGEPY
jgi:hypothetical protein